MAKKKPGQKPDEATPKDKPNKVEKEMGALNEIHDTLSGFTAEQQMRVLTTVAMLFDLDLRNY